jgi:hypothetical protein
VQKGKTPIVLCGEFMVEHSKLLYRYYANEDYILDVLKNKRLYHCNPSEFNDPFDCCPLIAIKHGISDNDLIWRDYYYYYIKMHDKVYKTHRRDSEMMKHAELEFKKGLHRNQSWLNKYVVDELRTFGSQIRVCCFAKSPRNMMMWTHYANRHRGVALIFRKSQLHDKTSNEFRGIDVTYDSRALNVRDFVKAFEQHFKHGDVWALPRIIHATKTKHWKSEEEVRFFALQNRQYLSFNESALYGIVFGDKCSKSFIRKVQNNLDQWQHKPSLFKASIEKSTLKLWIGKHADFQPQSAFNYIFNFRTVMSNWRNK